MIAALWHRWFDSREHRRAREAAEANYGQTLVREAFAKRRLATTEGLLAEVTRERDALAGAADGHIGLLHEELTNVRKSYAEALDTISGLRRQVEELRTEKDPATVERIADQHAEVSKLPPALTRDRQALARLEDELAAARERIEQCEREHR